MSSQVGLLCARQDCIPKVRGNEMLIVFSNTFGTSCRLRRAPFSMRPLLSILTGVGFAYVTMYLLYLPTSWIVARRVLKI